MVLARDANASKPVVKLNGAPLMPPQLNQSIMRVVVERQRNLPAMCEVEFLNNSPHTLPPAVIDNPLMRPGAALEIEASPATMDDPTQTALGPLFDGEVVAVEASFTPGSSQRFLLRGYDKSHRMHRQRRTETFTMTPDNIIVSNIAREHGLTTIAEPTGGPHEYVCQRNQTDWEFILERARENGFEVGMSLGNLLFRRAGADPTAGIPQRLTLGQGLLSFRLRATSAEQPQTTKVYGWNSMLKQQIMMPGVPATGENIPVDPQLLPMTIAARLGSSEDAGVDIPMDLPPQAAANATARAAHFASASVEAEGSCRGNPAMVPGGKITVDGLGTSFSTDYVLTTVRHVFDFDHENYVTSFTVSGLHDRSLFGLAHPGAATRANGHEGGGGANTASPMIGKVSNTNDEMQRGRVKVEFPSLGDAVESHWAPVVSVGGGDGKGFQCTPEVGDQVLVVFEQGDMRRPYVLGGVYGPPTELPEPQVLAVADGETKLRVFKTSGGHVLRFAETLTPPEQSITLETSGGSKLVIQESPTNEITLIAGQHEITIDATTQKITMKTLGEIAIEATRTLSLKGTAGVDIESNGPVNIKSTAKLTLEAVGIAELKGSLVKIN
ncbi:VgrG-related protein [Nitriliruptor alkaliphilus]|uniref:VgrG-related protein n=1 Tax=Nitriliruptor alkaliphilus TaxID=427918 RepID=UPI0006961529|nr:VgrG-related protein [Nitriliruptor alkaliphilus]